MGTWTLTPAEFEATVERAERINARAAKRGFTGRIEVTGAHREVKRTNELTLRTETHVVVDTEVTGEAPSYGGWTFLAAVDELPDGGDGVERFVLRYAPGAAAADGDRNHLVSGRCQHCNTTRGNRRYTYLVRNDATGEAKQVGSTCIQDFTGWQGRPVFIDVSTVEEEIEDRCFFGGGEPALIPTDVIAAARGAIRAFGWVAASAWTGIPTSGRVRDYFFDVRKPGQEARAAMAEYMDAADVEAPVIVETLRARLTGEAGYEANLLEALGAPYITARQLGLVVSAVSAYDRLLGQDARRAAQPDRAAVVHQGVEGQKLTIGGTITKRLELDGDHGVKLLIVVESATAVVKTFTTAAWAWDVEVGQAVTLTGTVKRHETYQGTAQTLMTRCKGEVTPAPAAALAAA